MARHKLITRYYDWSSDFFDKLEPHVVRKYDFSNDKKAQVGSIFSAVEHGRRFTVIASHYGTRIRRWGGRNRYTTNYRTMWELNEEGLKMLKLHLVEEYLGDIHK